MNMAKDWNRNVLFFIFALSGFAGLIYESIWSHYLKLFLGHAAYAQVLVLAIFMGGMAIGAWLAGKYTHRINRLFLWYAIAELALAIIAFLFHWIYTSVIGFSYETLMPVLGHPYMVVSYKWFISAVLILPQSILLGTTFPLMSNGVIRRFPGIPGFDISMLYFTNSFGAAIGVLASGFILISWVGLPGTLITAGVINVVVALLTFLAACVVRYDSDSVRTSVREQGAPEGPKSVFVFILFAAGVTGAASFMYEIGWIRLLGMVLGSSTHAFELMLSAFILGIALGGLWIRKRIDAIKNPIAFLAIVQLVMGVLALATVVSYGQTYTLMSMFMTALAKTVEGYWMFNVFSHFIAMIVMIPVTFCAGMTLPLMTSILMKNHYGEKSVGGVYAANTLGSIIGIAVAVMVILPMFSLKAVVVSGAVLDVVLAILLILWFQGRLKFPAMQYPEVSRGKGMVLALSSIVGIALLFWVGVFVHLDPNRMAAGVYRGGQPILKDTSRVIYKRDGQTATVTVTKTEKNLYVIATNGKPDASVDWNDKTITLDEPTQILMAGIPLSIYNSPTTAAVVGFGSGVTTHTLLDMPTMKRVDTIEIEPAMVEGAMLFSPRNTNAYTSARSHIHYDDAKSFFSTYQRDYDLIISEPSNPWVSGVSGLFSTEFYKLAQNHLTSDGMFVQWLNTYEMNMALIVSVIKSINEVFPYYAIYATDDTDILIIAKTSSPVGVSSSNIFSIDRLRGALNHIGISNVNDLDLRRLATEEILRPYLKIFKAPANSDYYPYLDLNSVKSRFLKTQVVNFNNLGFLIPVSMLESDTPRLEIKSVSSNFGFKRAEVASKALLLYHGIMQTPAFAKAKVPVDVRVLINLLAPPEIKCLTGKSATDAWNNAFFTAGSIMTNYLSSENVAEAFNAVRRNSCVRDMPQLSQDLFAMFQAVGLRNASGMARVGEKILKENPGLDKNAQAYVLSVAMLGLLDHDHFGEAVSLWREYNARVYQGNLPSGTMQVIFAYALDHFRNG